MTQFIQETRSMLEFSKDFRKFLNLLEKPKSLSDLETGLEDLEVKLKQKVEAETVIKKAAKLDLDLSSRESAIAKLEKDSSEKNKMATEAFEAIEQLKVQTSKDSESLAQKLKATEAARVKAEAVEKKANDKQVILDGELDKAVTLKKELEASIASYNSAISSLKAVKIA